MQAPAWHRASSLWLLLLRHGHRAFLPHPLHCRRNGPKGSKWLSQCRAGPSRGWMPQDKSVTLVLIYLNFLIFCLSWTFGFILFKKYCIKRWSILMAETWARPERERPRRVPHPPHQWPSLPKLWGSSPFSALRTCPEPQATSPAPRPSLPLVPWRLTWPLSHATCAHSQTGTLSVQQLYMQMLVPHITRQLWPESLLQSCHRHCGKLKKVCSGRLLRHFCLLTILHHSSGQSHLPFGQTPICWWEVTTHSCSCRLQQQWIWDMLLSSS